MMSLAEFLSALSSNGAMNRRVLKKIKIVNQYVNINVIQNAVSLRTIYYIYL